MSMDTLKKRIRIAAGKQPADLVIKNARIVNVFTHQIQEGDIAVSDGMIAAIGEYNGIQEVDAGGLYAIPGLIDSHIHVESSFLTPEEFGRIVVPRGTTTTISDPHEIVNVRGMEALKYMLKAAENTLLDIRYVVPSCVPATQWEDSGAVLDAETMREALHLPGVMGVGEFMNGYGVINEEEDVLAKLVMAEEEGALVDGHAPGLMGRALAGYMAAGIINDHECGSLEEMQLRLENGMYVQLRYGSACRELPLLLKGVTPENARRCILCSDDRQPLMLLEDGHMDDSLRVCVENGIDPITAIQMATLNTAECYSLRDRGAIAPARRADIALVRDLKDFHVEKVWICGELAAENGRYLPEIHVADPGAMNDTMHVKPFTKEQITLRLTSDHVRVIDTHPGTVLSEEGDAFIRRTPDGVFSFDPALDVAQISVIERHHCTGNMANALIRGYGIKHGAIAISMAHDSHNIITVGVNADEIYHAVQELIAQRGGIVLVKDGKVLERLPLPVAGLMSDRPAEEVRDAFDRIHSTAWDVLEINPAIEPVMTLVFMSLPVIPDLKITDRGLFNVNRQKFVTVER